MLYFVGIEGFELIRSRAVFDGLEFVRTEYIGKSTDTDEYSLHWISLEGTITTVCIWYLAEFTEFRDYPGLTAFEAKRENHV